MDDSPVNTEWPTIAGQKSAYLEKQLLAFKSGSRHSPDERDCEKLDRSANQGCRQVLQSALSNFSIGEFNPSIKRRRNDVDFCIPQDL